MARSFIDIDDVGILESPDEILTTLRADGKRKWMYPVLSLGRWLSQRRVVAWALIVFFVGLPIVHIGGKPAVLLDIARREFTFFGTTFLPTDTFLLLLLALSIAFGILLFTALLGRVWCGWMCPQTVYLEFVYRPIERLIEGDAFKQARRDRGPWNWDKLWRKGVKLSLFLVLSFALAHTFAAYFVGWDRLLTWMQGSPVDHWGYFVLATGTTLAMLYNFGYFREQLCTIACPYARIQSVLLDEDSLIVSYDPNRGEPRGKRKIKSIPVADRPPTLRSKEPFDPMHPDQVLVDESGLGDCVACGACVRTCPTGIDIRDGLQMECLHCTQCIDACDAIMDRVGKPRGLIRYTSEHELSGLPTRRVRPRTLIYGLLTTLLFAAFSFSVATRQAYDVNVGRATGPPFTVLPDGRIANRLAFRVQNQTGEPAQFTVDVLEPAGADSRLVGQSPTPLAPGELGRVEVWVLVDPSDFSNGQAEGLFRVSVDPAEESAAPIHAESVGFPLLGPGR